MELASRMKNEKYHFLSKEYCHFDGNHKRLGNFVTLTASAYHPMLQKTDTASHNAVQVRKCPNKRFLANLQQGSKSDRK